MTKLLMIADDMTGTLDTGVQFAQLGISVEICADASAVPKSSDAQVLAVNSNTRHLPPDEAYRVVSDIISGFKGRVQYIYKKTDSALRGCVGAELTAAARTMDSAVAFVPALPRLGRTTVNATQYINGVELAKSEFGRDPLEPMRNSYIPHIIAEQSDIACRIGGSPSRSPEICIFDASTDDEIMNSARRLVQEGTELFAGCAGLATALAQVLPFEKGDTAEPMKTASFGVVCGSLNPTTAVQMDYAAEHGFKMADIDGKEFLKEDFAASSLRADAIKSILGAAEEKLPFILKAGGAAVSGGNSGELVSGGLGSMAKELLPALDGYTLLLTGGDTLMAFIRHCGYPSLSIIRELSSGVVCLLADIDGKKMQLVSKSGGFGDPELFYRLYKIMKD